MNEDRVEISKEELGIIKEALTHFKNSQFGKAGYYNNEYRTNSLQKGITARSKAETARALLARLS